MISTNSILLVAYNSLRAVWCFNTCTIFFMPRLPIGFTFVLFIKDIEKRRGIYEWEQPQNLTRRKQVSYMKCTTSPRLEACWLALRDSLLPLVLSRCLCRWWWLDKIPYSLSFSLSLWLTSNTKPFERRVTVQCFVNPLHSFIANRVVYRQKRKIKHRSVTI